MSEPSEPTSQAPRKRPTVDVPPSVLSVLSERIGEAPRISLRDEPSHEGGAPVIAPSAGDRALLPEGRGSYTVLGEIARGGMGAVLRGHDTDLGRDVAMKVMHKELAGRPEIVRRFVEEAQIGGQLQHPGIVPVYELGLMADERPYFTMKLVKGRTLATLLAERESTASDRRRLLDVFESMCQTVAYAHSRGVIHRDLKPANVMVGAFGEVQVVDWGLAKVLARGGVEDERRAREVQSEHTVLETVRSDGSGSGSQSLVGSVMGTPSYMPPEQASGRVDRLDERADVFALGAILCEILTGAPPYAADSGTTLQQAANADLDDAMARLDACGADAELIRIARQCLMAAPAARPRNAGVVATSMQAWMEGQEERARTAQIEAAEARVRATQERKARRLTLALATTVIASLTLGGGAWLRAERSRSEQAAETERQRAAVRTEVDAAVGEAQLAAAREQWQPARSALDRARALVETGGEPALAASVTAASKEIEAAAENARVDAERRADTARLLDELRAARNGIEIDPLADASQQEAALYSRFPAILAAHGLDVDRGEAHDVARELEARGLGSDVAMLLDAWAATRRASGDEHGALHLLEVAHAVDPDPVRMDLREAVSNGDPAMLATLAESDPAEQSPDTLELLGSSLARVGDVEGAVAMLERALVAHPGSARLHRLAAELLTPGNTPFFDSDMRRLARRALEHRRAVLALEPESAMACFELGLVHLRLMEFRASLPLLEETMRRTGQGNYTRLSLACALIGARTDLPRALRLLNGMQEATTSGAGNALRGQLESEALWRLGDKRAALEVLQHVVQEYRLSIQPRIDLVAMQAEVGDLDGAVREFEANAPRNSSAYNNMAWALATADVRGLTDRDYARRVGLEAVRFAELATQVAPDDPNQWNTRGAAHLQLGEFEAALEDIRHAIELRGNDSDPNDQMVLSAVYAELGQREAAHLAFERYRPWIDGTIDDPLDPHMQCIVERAARLIGAEFVRPEWWEEQP